MAEMYTAEDVRKILYAEKDADKAAGAMRFFQTAPGAYGAHDQFLGIAAARVRAIAKQFAQLDLDEVAKLLAAPFNEERACALVILQHQYTKASEEDKKRIIDFYITHKDAINNWNLVDISAAHLIGDWAVRTGREILDPFVEADVIWYRRIAMVATHAFIRKGIFEPTLDYAERLLTDPEPLMHKATGWMLREVGKKDEKVLCDFLDRFCQRMPRTTLRYAIERLSPEQRHIYMSRR